MRKAIDAFLILVLIGWISGCKSDRPEKTEPPASGEGVTVETTLAPSGKVITSTDGICQITTIGGWDVAKGLHKKAKLQASNPFKEMHLVVFTEKKDMFPGMTLKEYSETTGKNLMKSLTSGYAKPAVQLTLDGNPAIQHEIHGTAVGNTKVVYLHTNVETPFYFHEILAWSTDRTFKQNKFALDGVVKSFKEVKAAPANGSSQP